MFQWGSALRKKKDSCKTSREFIYISKISINNSSGRGEREVAGGAKNESSTFILWARKPKIKANLVNFPRFSAFLWGFPPWFLWMPGWYHACWLLWLPRIELTPHSHSVSQCVSVDPCFLVKGIPLPQLRRSQKLDPGLLWCALHISFWDPVTYCVQGSLNLLPGMEEQKLWIILSNNLTAYLLRALIGGFPQGMTLAI